MNFFIVSRQVSPFHRPRRPLGRIEVYLSSILDVRTRRGWGVSVTPRQHLTPGKDQVPIVQEAGWASGPVWTDAENLVPPGFDPRTVQPVGSRYTDWATRPIMCALTDCTSTMFCIWPDAGSMSRNMSPNFLIFNIDYQYMLCFLTD